MLELKAVTRILPNLVDTRGRELCATDSASGVRNFRLEPAEVRDRVRPWVSPVGAGRAEADAPQDWRKLRDG